VKSAANNEQVGDITMMEDRYYVQRLTEQVFLIRERTSEMKGQDPMTALCDRSSSAMMPICMLTL